jgi:hypothetical protein
MAQAKSLFFIFNTQKVKVLYSNLEIKEVKSCAHIRAYVL